MIFVLSLNNTDKKIFLNNIVNHFSNKDICILINNSNAIKSAIKYHLSIQNVLQENSIIEKDPVIYREFTQYLIDAKQKEKYQFDEILNTPSDSMWFNNKEQKHCKNKRNVQELLSNVLESVYYNSPIIENELINRDNPSSQAHSGRKKLLLNLLNNHNKKDLSIDKFPAEKSMYIAILKNSGIHTKKDKKWQIQPPNNNEKYLKVWKEIDKFFNNLANQTKNLDDLTNVLSSPPFGIKKPILPIFYIANYLYNKNEIAVYEDRIYVPYFTSEHLERFLKRPDTFTFQQFKINNINQLLMQEYENNLLTKKPDK
jgi:hypothetical protein